VRFNRSKELERPTDAADERTEASASAPALAAASDLTDDLALIRVLHSHEWEVLPPGAWKGMIADHEARISELEARVSELEAQLDAAEERGRQRVREALQIGGEALERGTRLEFQLEDFVAAVANVPDVLPAGFGEEDD